MSAVTREMIGAGHGATLKQGIVLSHEVLTEIYLSMDGLANHAKTSGSPRDEALLRQALHMLVRAKYELVGVVTTTPALDELIDALRERLGENT